MIVWLVQPHWWFDLPVAITAMSWVCACWDDKKFYTLGIRTVYRYSTHQGRHARCLRRIEQLEIEMGIHFETEMEKLERTNNPVIEVEIVADPYTSPSRKVEKIQWARYNNANRRGQHGVGLEPYDYNSAAEQGIASMDLYSVWDDGMRDRPFVVPSTRRGPKKVIHVDPPSITARSSDIADNLGLQVAKTTEHWENESCNICDMQKHERAIAAVYSIPDGRFIRPVIPR